MILSLLICSNIVSAQQVTINGRVTDSETGDPLMGASVYTPDKKTGTATGRLGFYTISISEDKDDVLCFSYVGYKTETIKISASDQKLNVVLTRDNQLAGVTVQGSHNYGVTESQMSAINVPMSQVRSMPQLFGEVDILKALQKLPGVQNTADGHAGILVRGGNYDQNLISIDGTILYNTEHLEGYISALNADMTDNIQFFKGAFPARYGSKLSGIIDVGLKDGNLNEYHGTLNVGMMSSGVTIEGPIRKGSTSFIVSGRASYLNWIAMPVFKKVYDDTNALNSYLNMNFYDVSAKITHLFSQRDKISAMVYFGKDWNNYDTDRTSYEAVKPNSIFKGGHELNADTQTSYTHKSWYNIATSVNYVHSFNDRVSMNSYVSFSQFKHSLTQGREERDTVYTTMIRWFPEVSHPKQGEGIGEDTSPVYIPTHIRNQVYSHYSEDSYIEYQSIVNDWNASSNMLFKINDNHKMRAGLTLNYQQFKPTIRIFKNALTERNDTTTQQVVYTDKSNLNKKYQNPQNTIIASVYAEDDWDIFSRLKANIGLRYSAFIVDDKSYHSIEPRLSMRLLILSNLALKMSYSRMAQSSHQLSSGNLIMPSSVWVSSTKDIPLMKSDQFAAGVTYEPHPGIELTTEGYYKKLDNILDYRQGVSYMSTLGDWQKMVVLGDGRTFGVELILHKKTGRTTGWISYTWSKSLCTFDRQGMILNNGKEFLAGNDRRHNFNIILSQKLGKHFVFSATWTFQTGRRGNIATTEAYFGKIKELSFVASDPSSSTFSTSFDPYESTQFTTVTKYNSYYQKNSYVLPNIHRLDVNLAYTLKSKKVAHTITLSIYNLYNRKNISDIYMAYENRKLVLKGICKFPIIPSINYILKF